jgi:hypothetical protein
VKVCYRRSDGLYCDSERSWPARYPGDGEFVRGPNVMGRFGGAPDDYAVVDADAPEPWLRRWVDGRLVDDTEKLDAIASARAQQAERHRRVTELSSMIRDGSATVAELQEFMRERLLADTGGA